MLNFLRCILLLCCCGLVSGAQAAPVVRIGVLAFQSPADTLAQWLPTAQSLQRAMPQTRFEVVPLSYEALDAAVQARQLDFVLTNPEHYVVLRNQHKLRPMATINQKINNQVVDQFGSVIFTPAGSGIQTLAQVRGKRVAAVGLNSLGGYLMAADVFLAQSLQLENSKDARVSFLGVPHSRVVQAVLAGQADVGIVRTGVLEQMAAAGKLDLHQLRVLNAQPPARFPQLLSTDLYAEWPWAAMPDTAPELTRAVLLGLLQISADSEAAHAGRYQGFSIPANYTPVEELMRRLHVYPGQDAFPTLQTLWLRYEHWIEIGLGLISLFWTALLIYFWRSNRRLKELTRLNRESQTSLELTAAAFNSQVGLIVTDELTRIQRANPAMKFILGFDEIHLIGQATSILRGASVSSGTLRTLWEEVKTHGRWQGELLCQHRDGHDVPCMVSISTIRNPATGLTGFVGSFADITAQKKSADDIKQLAYFDTLTGLPNRRMFLERLQTTLDTALAEGTLAGLMFIDLAACRTQD